MNIYSIVFVFIHVLIFLSLYRFGDKIRDILFYNYIQSDTKYLYYILLYMVALFISFPYNLFQVYSIILKKV